MAVRTRSHKGNGRGGYGWTPQLPDHRDFLFAPDMQALRELANLTHVDLSTDPAMPPVWNQGELGSCTAHSVGAAFAFAHQKAGNPAMMPARLWIYFQERVIEGTVDQDAGAMIRDGFRVISTLGVPPETDWPYDIATFTEPPSSVAESDAVLHKALVYRAVMQDLTQIKAVLASGYPVSFGFSVYESFESEVVAATGTANLPAYGEPCVGGHAVLIVGFDDPTQRFLVRNSWSADWGEDGYFTLPYAYVTNPNLASDFWTCSIAS